ncbi:Aste57867_1143 [Aphanomyces stellatus]|uniref:Aste57867_1143 protein n=1 Tax=Aphanomyces stellatus TaxID=120398 RepID=A0A485K9K3_9STRA|nr:hypothetical protein As57867_001142 [Aphanomyces stellatus]VFT78363.1 Aste57867_1143 [Aphanomyces stellatus]
MSQRWLGLCLQQMIELVTHGRGRQTETGTHRAALSSPWMVSKRALSEATGPRAALRQATDTAARKLRRAAGEDGVSTTTPTPAGEPPRVITQDPHVGVITHHPNTTAPLPPPPSTTDPSSSSDLNTSMVAGIILGSLAAVLVIVAIVLLVRRRRARQTAEAQAAFKPTDIQDDETKYPHHSNHTGRRDPHASVYATDFPSSSEYRDSQSPSAMGWNNHHQQEGSLSEYSSSNNHHYHSGGGGRRKADRVPAELPQPFFYTYNTQRRSSVESQDSSIISYSESEKGIVRYTTASTSTADETPRGGPSTPYGMREDEASSLTSSVSFANLPGATGGWGSASSNARLSSFSQSIIVDLSHSQSPGSSFSLTMLDESQSQTSSRESYDI